MKFVLTVCLIFLQIDSCKIVELYPKHGEYETIDFKNCECDIFWTRNDTSNVLCSCVSSVCTSHASRYSCSHQDLNIKFDASEDIFVIKGQCCDELEYYTFSKKNGSPSINPGLWILFMSIITIWVTAS